MRRLSQLTPVAVATLLLATWEFGVRAAAVPQFILPAPSVIAVRFAEAWADGTMLRHLVPTVTEVTVGGLLGGVLGHHLRQHEHCLNHLQYPIHHHHHLQLQGSQLTLMMGW